MVTATAQMAEQHPNVVVGVVSQQKLLTSKGQLHFTPGKMDHVMTIIFMFITPSRCSHVRGD